jgi:hypothetical protein
MKNILIIGDSHTAKSGNATPDMFYLKNRSLKFTTSEQFYTSHYIENNEEYWIKDDLKMYEDSNLKIWMSAHPGRSALNYDFENFATGTQKHILDSWDKEGNIVMPWFGYIDIKNWLPQKDLSGYKSAEEVVDTYVNNVINKFNKCEIIFIEPLPQFICIVTNNWARPESDPDIQFEERHEQHILFVDALRKKCSDLGLKAPISPAKILGTEMIEPYMQYKKPLKLLLNDHMTPKYYEIIVDYLVKNT